MWLQVEVISGLLVELIESSLQCVGKSWIVVLFSRNLRGDLGWFFFFFSLFSSEVLGEFPFPSKEGVGSRSAPRQPGVLCPSPKSLKTTHSLGVCYVLSNKTKKMICKKSCFMPSLLSFLPLMLLTKDGLFLMTLRFCAVCPVGLGAVCGMLCQLCVLHQSIHSVLTPCFGVPFLLSALLSLSKASCVPLLTCK